MHQKERLESVPGKRHEKATNRDPSEPQKLSFRARGVQFSLTCLSKGTGSAFKGRAGRHMFSDAASYVANPGDKAGKEALQRIARSRHLNTQSKNGVVNHQNVFQNPS